MNEDAAVLRLAFEEAARNQAGWMLELRHPNHPWHSLHDIVTDTTCGLTLLAHMAYLQAEVDRLESELAAERKKTAGEPLYVRPQRLETR